MCIPEKKIRVSKLRGEIQKRSLYLKTARRLTKGNNFSVISVSMAAGGFVEAPVNQFTLSLGPTGHSLRLA